MDRVRLMATWPKTIEMRPNVVDQVIYAMSCNKQALWKGKRLHEKNHPFNLTNISPLLCESTSFAYGLASIVETRDP